MGRVPPGAFGSRPGQPYQYPGMTKILAKDFSALVSPAVGKKLHCSAWSELGLANYLGLNQTAESITDVPIIW
jgi:hypothetical protein